MELNSLGVRSPFNILCGICKICYFTMHKSLEINQSLFQLNTPIYSPAFTFLTYGCHNPLNNCVLFMIFRAISTLSYWVFSISLMKIRLILLAFKWCFQCSVIVLRRFFFKKPRRIGYPNTNEFQ